MRRSSDAWSTEKSYSIQKQLIWQKNHPVSYSRVRETLRIWSTQHSVQLMRNARPHKVFEEWSTCKTQTSKCFSKRNSMLNTGKVITNRSCLHSAYSSKLELPLPNSLDCKAVAKSWFIDRYEKAQTQWGTFAPDRHQSSSHTNLLIPQNSAQARWASVLCEGKGHGWPGLTLQQHNFQAS